MIFFEDELILNTYNCDNDCQGGDCDNCDNDCQGSDCDSIGCDNCDSENY